MNRKRIVWYVLLAAVFLLLARFAYSEWRFHAVGRNFDRIHDGQTRREVIAILGKPNYHAGACLYDLHISDHCSSELVYSPPFAPWIPHYYVVDFSGDGNVIAAGELTSP